MANIFYLRANSDTDLQAAYTLAGISGTASFSGGAGWYIVGDDGTPTRHMAGTNDTEADTVYLTGALLDFFHSSGESFSAGGGDDTYIITQSFATAADATRSPYPPDVRIGDNTGKSVFVFETGVEINSVFYSSTELSFGFKDGTQNLKIASPNGGNIRFKINTAGDELSVVDFLREIGASAVGRDNRPQTLSSPFTVPEPPRVLDDITAVTVTDTAADNTAGDDTFTHPSGTFTITGAADDARFNVAGEVATVSGTDPAGFTHKVTSSDYGTLYYNNTTGAWEFAVDDAAVEDLVLGVTQSATFAVNIVGDSSSKDLVIEFVGANESGDHASMVTELESSGPSFTIHGVRFTDETPDAPGNNLTDYGGIFVGDKGKGIIVNGTSSIVFDLMGGTAYSQQDLIDLWNSNETTKALATARIVEVLDATTGANLKTNYGAPSVSEPMTLDKSVTIDLDDDTGNSDDTMAGGVLDITDSDGVKSVKVTAGPTYGTFTLNNSDYSWSYTLVRATATAALTKAGTVQDTITLTITDDDDNTTNYGLVIDITVNKIDPNGPQFGNHQKAFDNTAIGFSQGIEGRLGIGEVDTDGRSSSNPLGIINIQATVPGDSNGEDNITYSLAVDPADAGFVIDKDTGVITYEGPGIDLDGDQADPNDHDDEKTFKLTVTATAGANGASNNYVLTLIVGQTDEAPIFDQGATSAAGISQLLDDNANTAIAIKTLRALDPEGADVTYTLASATFDGNAVDGFAVDGTSGAVTFNGATHDLTNGVYTLKITASTGAGGTATHTLTVNVAESPPPTLNAPSGTTGSVAENAATQTDTGITFTVGNHPALAADDFTVSETGVDGMAVSESTRFGVVSDGSGGWKLVLLAGNALDHEARAVDQMTGMPTPIALKVKVTNERTDDGGSDDLDSNVVDVMINVTNVNEAPSITSLATVSLGQDENTEITAGKTLYTVAFDDPDSGDTHSFAIKDNGNSDNGALFKVDGQGRVSLKAALTPDYETQTSYTFTVVVTDSGGLTAEQVVTMRINDLDEAPVFVTAPTTASFAENMAGDSGTPVVITTVAAEDPDRHDVTYTLTASSGSGGSVVDESARFAIDEDSGEITYTGAAINFEGTEATEFTLVVTASSKRSGAPDGEAAKTATHTLMVSVDDVPEGVMLSHSGTATLSETASSEAGLGSVTAMDADNPTATAFTYSLVGAPAGFAIDSTNGAISYTRPSEGGVDHETAPTITLTVRAVSDADANRNGTGEVVVTIADADEGPVFAANTPTEATIAENVGGTVTIATVMASDLDAKDSGATVTYGISASVLDGDFAIARDGDGNGVITYTGGGIDFETNPTITLTITASTGTDAAERSSTHTLTLNVTDVNEGLPEFTTTGVLSIAENTDASGSGAAVNLGTVMNTVTGLTWSLVNAPDGFEIDGTSGVITYNGTGLDHEAAETITLMVRAVSGDGVRSRTQGVEITVSDVNEAPFFVTGSPTEAMIEENDPSVANVVQLTARDDDEVDKAPNAITYDLDQPSKDKGFTIASTGRIQFNAPSGGTGFDHEVEAQRTHEITVTATDSAGNTAMHTVTITVTDVEDTITINLRTPDDTADFTGGVYDLAENMAGPVNIAIARADTTAAVMYSLAVDPAVDGFDIDSATGLITYTGSGLDHEATSVITLTINAEVGGETGKQTLRVRITDEEEAPVVDGGLTGTIADTDKTGTAETIADATGTFTASDDDMADSEVGYSFAVAGASTSTESSFTHQVDGVVGDTTYGTLFYNQGSGAWKFVANAAAVDALGASDTQDVVFTVTATGNRPGDTMATSTETNNFTITITGVDEPADVATSFTEGTTPSYSSITIHGVTFTSVAPGTTPAGSGRWKITVSQAGGMSAIAGTSSTYQIKLTANNMNFTPQDLLDLWRGVGGDGNLDPRNEDITAALADGTDANAGVAASTLFRGTQILTGGEDIPTADKSVTLSKGALSGGLDRDASGTLTITDGNGVMPANVTHSAPVYGSFTFTETTSGSGVYNWTYTLNPADGDTAALTADTTETITITVTDNVGYEATYDLVINITVNNAPVAPMFEAQMADEGAAWSYQIPVFTDAEDDAATPAIALTYAATLMNGNALPDWVAFDANSRTFTIAAGATDNPQVDDHTFTVTATDSTGATTAGTFTLTINNVAEAPVFTNGAVAAASVGNTGTTINSGDVVYDAEAMLNADPGAMFTWGISGGADQGLFGIGRTDGHVSFAADTALDLGTKAYYVIEVTATNSAPDNTESVTQTLYLQVAKADGQTNPIVLPFDAVTVSDTALRDELFANETGDFSPHVFDHDSTSFTYAVASGGTTAETTTERDGFTHKVARQGEGVLFYNENTGAWLFDVDDAGLDDRTDDQDLVLTFTVTVTDGDSNATTEDLTITLDGMTEPENTTYTVGKNLGPINYIDAIDTDGYHPGTTAPRVGGEITAERLVNLRNVDNALFRVPSAQIEATVTLHEVVSVGRVEQTRTGKDEDGMDIQVTRTVISSVTYKTAPIAETETYTLTDSDVGKQFVFEHTLEYNGVTYKYLTAPTLAVVDNEDPMITSGGTAGLTTGPAVAAYVEIHGVRFTAKDAGAAGNEFLIQVKVGGSNLITTGNVDGAVRYSITLDQNDADFTSRELLNLWNSTTGSKDARLGNIVATLVDETTADSDGVATTTLVTASTNLMGGADNPHAPIDEGTVIDTDQVIYTATATGGDADRDGDVNIFWSIAEFPGDGGLFSINSSTGEVTFKERTILDFEDKASYTFTVEARDGLGDTITRVVTLTVADVDPEAPSIDAGATTEFSIAENVSGAGTPQMIGTVTATAGSSASVTPTDITYTLSTEPSVDGFMIDTNGVITYNGGGLDHEATPTITLTVVASNNGGSATHTLTLTVTDENEAPRFVGNLPTTATFAENDPYETIGTFAAQDHDEANPNTLIFTAVADGDGGNVVRITLRSDAGLTDQLAAGTKVGVEIDDADDNHIIITYNYNETVTLKDIEGAVNADTAANMLVTVSRENDADDSGLAGVELHVTQASLSGGVTERFTRTDGTMVENHGDKATLEIVEDHDVTYSLNVGSDTGFEINPASGIVNYTGPALDLENLPTGWTLTPAGTSAQFNLVVTATSYGGTATHMVTVTLTDVNEHAPTATPAMLDAISAGAAHTFTEADFGFMDEDASGALASVTITSVPTEGTLALDGTDVTANQTITADDITKGKLVYTAANPSSASVEFSYTVSDGMRDSSAAMMSIEVTPFNNPPVLVPITATLADTAADDDFTTPLSGNFNTSVDDMDDADTHTFSVTGATLLQPDEQDSGDPGEGFTHKVESGTYGTLYYNQGSGAWEYAVKSEQVDAINMLASGASLMDTFMVTATDDDATTPKSSNAATFTITINGANDTPTFTASTTPLAVNEGGTVTITLASLGLDSFADRDTGDTLQSITITELPGEGDLFTTKTRALNTLVSATPATISRATIDNGDLVFRANNDLNADTDRTLTFTATDGNGGTTAAASITIRISATDAAATAIALSSNASSIDENTAITAEKVADITFTDADMGSPGAVELAGTNVSAFEIRDAAGGSGKELWRVANANGFDHETTPTLSVRVQLTGDTDVYADYTLTIDDVNEAPTLTEITGTVTETAAVDADTEALTGNFNPSVSDVDGDDTFTFSVSGAVALAGDQTGMPGDGFTHQVTSGTYGTLFYNETSGAWKFVLKAAVDALDETQTGLTDTFMVTATDDDADNPETSTAQTFTITVNGANDRPIATTGTVTVSEDATHGFAGSEFGFTDVESDSLVSVTIVSLPAEGTLAYDGTDLVAGDLGTATATIAAGDLSKLVYTPPTTFNTNTPVTFTYVVNTDTAGDTNNPGTMTITVEANNDPATGITFANPVTLTDDADVTNPTKVADITLTGDPDGGTPSAVRLVTGMNADMFTINGTELLLNAGVTLAADTTLNAQVELVDDASVRATFALTIRASNNAPTASPPNTLMVDEENTITITEAHLGYSDTDSDDLHSITITAVPDSGELRLNGEALSVNDMVTGTQITAGNLVYHPATDLKAASTATSFKFTASDGTASSAEATLNITVTADDDAPVVTPGTLAIDENRDGSGGNAVPVGTVAISDPEGDAFTYDLADADETAGFAIDTTTGAITYTGTGLNHEDAETITLTLEVTPQGGDKVDHTLTVTVNDIDEAPMFANATSKGGPVIENDSGEVDNPKNYAMIDAATDPDDGAMIMYTLDQASRDNGFRIGTIDTGEGTVQIDYVGAGFNYEDVNQRTQTLTITATANGKSDDHVLTINITNADEGGPVFTSQPSSFNLNENVTDFDFTAIVATDPDTATDTITYTLVAPPTGFTIDGTSGVITYSGAGFDYEGLTPGERAIALTVRATSTTNPGGATATEDHMVTVNVMDANEAPDLTVTSPAAVDDTAGADTFADLSGTFTAPDADMGDVVTFSVARSGVDEATSTITPDFTHMLAGDYGVLHYNKGTGAWRFVVDAAAVNALDDSEDVTDTFTVTATDDDTTPLSDSGTLTIAFNGADDAPVGLPSTGAASLAEDSDGTSTPVFVGTIRMRDPEGDEITFTLASNPNTDGFVITRTQNAEGFYEANITYTGDGSGLDHETAETITLTVTGTSSGGMLVRNLNVTIGDVNEAPVFAAIAAATGSLTLDDTAGADTFTNPEGTFTAPDEDGDTVTFSVARSGVTQSASSETGYDYQLAGTYGVLHYNETSGAWRYVVDADAVNALPDTQTDTFTVTATDDDTTPLSDSATLTITVNGADDAPVVDTASDSSATIAENMAGNPNPQPIGTVTMTDPEGNTVTYTLALADEDVGFAVDMDSGVVTYTGAGLDFERTATAVNYDVANKQYTLTVTGTSGPDGSELTTDHDIVVTVTNVNDAPVVGDITAPDAIEDTDAAVGDENFTNPSGTFTATDQDDDNNTLTFSVARSGATVGTSTITSDFTNMLAGDYGVLHYHSGTGEWRYVVNAMAVNALAAGATETDEFMVTAMDDESPTAAVSDPQTLTISVTGANDAPTLAAIDGGNIRDTADADASFGAPFGNFNGNSNDVDAGATLTFSVARSGKTLAPSGMANFTHMLEGDYGVLHYNEDTGAWRFAPNDAAINGLSANDTDVFTVTASDGMASVENTLTINLVGVNDTPTSSGGSVTITEDDTHPFTTGNFPFADRDADDTDFASVTIVSLPDMGTLILDDGTNPAIMLDSTNLEANKTIAFADIGNLSYDPGDGFRATSTDVTFKYTVSDGDASSAEATFTITVTADDDPATAIDLTGTDTDPTMSTLAEDVDTTAAMKIADIAITDADGGPHGLEIVATSATTLDNASFGFRAPGASADGPTLLIVAADKGDVGNSITVTIRSDAGLSGSDVLADDVKVDVVVNDDTSTTPTTRNIVITYNANHADGVTLYDIVEAVNEDTAATDEAADLVNATRANDGTDENGSDSADAFEVAKTNLTTVVDLSDMFEISGTELRLKAAPDAMLNHETHSEIDIRVQVMGSDPSIGDDLTLMIDDVNEKPVMGVITDPDAILDTDAAESAEMFADLTGTFIATDEDEGDANDSLIFSVTGTNSTEEVEAGDPAGFTHKVAGTYGVLYFHNGSDTTGDKGAWRFVVNTTEVNKLAGGAMEMDEFMVTAMDNESPAPAVSEAETLTIRVTGVNDIPTATPPAIIMVNEDPDHADHTHEFVDTDFGFMDEDTGDLLVSVTIVTLPTSGTLALVDSTTMVATPVTAGQKIEVADIPKLVYTPGDNFAAPTTSANHVTFTYMVNDGDADSAAASTMTIMVEADDDAATALAFADGARAILPQNFDNANDIRIATLDITDADGGSPGTLEVVATKLAEAASVSLMASGGSAGDPTLTFTADTAGTVGNAYTVTIRSDAGLTGDDVLSDDMDDDNTNGNQPEKVRVDVTGTDIVITYNDNAEGGVTLKDIVDAVNADTAAADEAADIVTASTNNEAAAAFAMAETSLAGGENAVADVKDRFKIADGELQLVANTTLTQGDMYEVSVRVADPSSVTTKTHTLTIGPDNTPPTADPASVMFNEDAPYAFKATDFNFMDADTQIPGFSLGFALDSITIESLPTAGTLTLDGAAVAAGDVIMATDLGTDDTPGKLVYTPVNTLAANGMATFTYTVSDGIQSSTPATTMTINIEANDDPATALAFADGARATLPQNFFSVISGSDLTIATLDITDTDEGMPGTLEVVALDTSKAVAATATLTSSGNTLTATAVDKGEGGSSITITIRANDTLMDDAGTAGMDERIKFTVSGTSITIEYKSDATPALTLDDLIAEAGKNADVSALVTFSTDDGTAAIFDVSAAGLSKGSDGEDASALFAVVDGELRLKEDAASTGSTKIAAGDVYEVSVQLMGTPSVTTDKHTLTIGADNARPMATAGAVTFNEDAPYTFKATDFPFTDGDSDALVSITIKTLPDAGTLTLDGAAVTAGDVIAVADIPKLVYTPVDTLTANGSATFMYTVSDGNYDSTPAVEMTLTIEADDDFAAITLANPVASIDENTAITDANRKVADITLTDTDMGTNVGTAELAGTHAEMFEIVGTELRLRANADGFDHETTETLTVRVQNAGDNDVYAEYTLTINDVNDAPVLGAITTPAAVADTPATDTFADLSGTFTATDADEGDSDASLTFSVASVASEATLTTPATPAVAVEAGDPAGFTHKVAGTYGELFYNNDTGAWRFVVDATAVNALAADATVRSIFAVTATDDGGEASAPLPLIIRFTGSNEAPTATAATLQPVSEGADLGFSTAHFGFTDDDGGTLQSVTIVTLPTAGTLTLGGVAVTAGQVIMADAIAGNLRYNPGDSFAENGMATFDYTVSDGTDSSATATMRIAVMADNDAATEVALADAATALMATDSSTATKIADITIIDPDGPDTTPEVPTLAGANAALFEIRPASSGGGHELWLKDGQTLTDGAMLQVRVELVRVPASDTIGVDHNIAITDNAAPTLAVDEGVAFNAGETILLNEGLLDATDNDNTDAQLTYTLTAITGGVLERDVSGTWTALATDGTATFTEAEVVSGAIRLNPTGDGSFTVTLSDEVDRGASITGTINFQQRVVIEAMGTQAGGADLDRSTETAPQTLITGFGDTTITPGSGDDEIDPGLGDDDIDLGQGGDDTVIYHYATDDAGKPTIAWSGGDDITGFTPGEDRLLFDEIDGDGTGMFLAGLNDGFIATISTAYDSDRQGGAGPRNEIGSYDVTGIEIHFSQAILLPGGVLGGSILTIEFANAIGWAEFNTTWLTAGAFSTTSLLFANNDAGKAALMEILGLGDTGRDDPRSAAIGNDANNDIDLTTASEAGSSWVVYGNGGDDRITLGAGTEEVVYRFTVDDSNDITAAPDGSDVVSGFTLGTDSLTFVDTDGEGTIHDLIGSAQRIALAAAFAEVSLNFDAANSTYTGITFGIVADDADTNDTDESVTLTVNFAGDGLDQDGLIAALGITDSGPVALADIFEGRVVPTQDSDDTTLSADGRLLIDELFGDGNISLDDSLPVELL